MKIKCIIVEDEPLALERTQDYVTRVPFLTLLASFENATEALLFLNKNVVDLIFLDIKMDGISGLELLENTKLDSEVIITTAYDQYALKGFDLNVTDYLLKPFTFERLLQAVEKAREKLKIKKAVAIKFIFVKTEYRLEKIMLDDILYIEGMRDYRRIHTKEKRIMTLQTFKDFELSVPEKIICRVHKSYMVAIDKIISVERDRIKISDVLIPISYTYRKKFLDLINQA